jgi:hypothetical protein
LPRGQLEERSVVDMTQEEENQKQTGTLTVQVVTDVTHLNFNGSTFKLILNGTVMDWMYYGHYCHRGGGNQLHNFSAHHHTGIVGAVSKQFNVGPFCGFTRIAEITLSMPSVW